MMISASDPALIAVFDIGSNAVRLSIYRLHGHQVTIAYKDVALCEMGRDLDRTGQLYPQGAQGAFAVLRRYVQLIRPGGAQACQGHIAFATEAVRRAGDGPDFLARLKQELHLPVRVLSEEEEGVLGARGVLRELPQACGIVADLGGGSLQLTRVGDPLGTVGDTFSMPLGTLRMLAAGEALDPYIQTHLAQVPPTLNQCDTLYVIGGSWRSFAKLYLARAQQNAREVQGVSLSPAHIGAMTQNLSGPAPGLTAAMLMNEYGLEQSRAQLMPHAAQLLTRLTHMLQAREVIVSTAGVRDGVIQGLIDGSITADPLTSPGTGPAPHTDPA